jgi:hypothetical protein
MMIFKYRTTPVAAMREIFVFSDRQIGSFAAWRQALNKEGFALRLSKNGPADELIGHVSAKLGKEYAGFECDQADSAEIMSHYPDVDFGQAWRFAWSFRSGPELRSNVASWIGAAILAKVTGGKVFEPPEVKPYSPEDVLGPLREVERDILQLEEDLKKLEDRPRTEANPSPAIISVRLWKEE